MLDVRSSEASKAAQENKENEPGKTNVINNNLFISIPQETEKWEKLIQWPFITHNKDLTEDLLTLLHNFQTLFNPITLTIHNSKVIHGTLLDEISEIINLFNKQPFHNKSYLCSLGSYNSESVRLSYRILHILISGIQFHHKLSPANF